MSILSNKDKHDVTLSDGLPRSILPILVWVFLIERGVSDAVLGLVPSLFVEAVL